MAERKARRARTDRRNLRQLLVGGDRRSLAQSNRARRVVEKFPERIAELAKLVDDPDWLVSVRAVDLLEKLAHNRPALVEPYKHIFIGPLADSEKWEVRLQVVRALSLFRWSEHEFHRVQEILERELHHPRIFVRAWALDSLATLAQTRPSLKPVVARQLRSFAASGQPSLVARARQIRQRLSTQHPAT